MYTLKMLIVRKCFIFPHEEVIYVGIRDVDCVYMFYASDVGVKRLD